MGLTGQILTISRSHEPWNTTISISMGLRPLIRNKLNTNNMIWRSGTPLLSLACERPRCETLKEAAIQEEEYCDIWLNYWQRPKSLEMIEFFPRRYFQMIMDKMMDQRLPGLSSLTREFSRDRSIVQVDHPVLLVFSAEIFGINLISATDATHKHREAQYRRTPKSKCIHHGHGCVIMGGTLDIW